MKTLPIITVVVLLVALVAILNMTSKKRSKKMRLLLLSQEVWLDHVYWTRLFIVSSVARSNDVTFNADRLMMNQEEIGNLYRPYIGDKMADELIRLLKEHIAIAGKIVEEARDGKETSVDVQDWQRNADDISKLIDPSLGKNYTAVRDMMLDHLDVTLKEAAAYIKGLYNESIAEFEKAKIMIADMSASLVKIICK